MKLHRGLLKFDNWHVRMTCYLVLNGVQADFAGSLMIRPQAPVHTFDGRKLWFANVEDGEIYRETIGSAIKIS